MAGYLHFLLLLNYNAAPGKPLPTKTKLPLALFGQKAADHGMHDLRQGDYFNVIGPFSWVYAQVYSPVFTTSRLQGTF